MVRKTDLLFIIVGIVLSLILIFIVTISINFLANNTKKVLGQDFITAPEVARFNFTDFNKLGIGTINR